MIANNPQWPLPRGFELRIDRPTFAGRDGAALFQNVCTVIELEERIREHEYMTAFRENQSASDAALRAMWTQRNRRRERPGVQCYGQVIDGHRDLLAELVMRSFGFDSNDVLVRILAQHEQGRRWLSQQWTNIKGRRT